MTRKTLLLLLFINMPSLFMQRHQKPVHKLLWTEHCTKNAVALNDCNWCWCDKNNQYACNARVCSDVDMFGHFNDAIREVDAGMEGRGVWRSADTPCEPGVHYRKSTLLCVCTEDGTWPNPVCRDIFQILHAVELTQYSHPSENQSCTPTKLHLIGCNVCVCPSSGTINPKYCTNRDCNERAEENSKETRTDMLDEIYATCNADHKYKLGCKSCICLRNNRLLCDNCTSESNQYLREGTSFCSGKKPNKIFKHDCNLCFCDDQNRFFCSTKKCLEKIKKLSKLKLPKFGNVNETKNLVVTPLRDKDCVPGTTFEKDCKTCHCILHNGVKSIACTLKQCSSSKILDLNGDCIAGTRYEVSCLTCYCNEEDGVKTEVCNIKDNCEDTNGGKIRDLDTMHGYCEPLHEYMKDCNNCKCLGDGRTIACETKLCPPEAPKRNYPDYLPIYRNEPNCPFGHSFKVDCNYCFCMRSGNAVCTGMKCGSKSRF